MQRQELIPHLFRTEFSKISSVLSRLFGLARMDMAEDIASETFLAALETWTYNGIPENPTAWLYTVAKNKARNFLQRDKLFSEKILPRIRAEAVTPADMDWSEEHIRDSQLQMLFTLCHPAIPPEAQIGLSLRILCGFGIDEIATAFLTNKETINKRLYRAKEKLREEKIEIGFPPAAAIGRRLDTVLATLYLLFSEGYYSEDKEEVIQEELCTEAMRLVRLLLENPATGLPRVNALYALMCFQASRFPARKSGKGELILYDQQDESLWNRDLIASGAYHLHCAATGDELSAYHLEASIAYWQTVKPNHPEKWEQMLKLYDHLLLLNPSPVVALNRVYVLSKVAGKQEAIAEAEKLNLTGSHFYYVLLGELYDDPEAKGFFEKALGLAKTASERQMIQKKLEKNK